MPIITEGGNVTVEGGYNDIARDMYSYSGNSVHQDYHVNTSRSAGADDFYDHNGQPIQNTGHGPGGTVYGSTSKKAK